MNEDILVEYVFTMIDKEGLNVITFNQFKKFLEGAGVVLSQNELEMLFSNLDQQKTGNVSIKDFKKNFTAELKTFSMARINMESDDDELLANKSPRRYTLNVDNIDISLPNNENNNENANMHESKSTVEKEEQNGNCDSIQFSCIKEPRHEFFSSLKKKNRLMVFGAKKMLYQDDNMNLMGDIPCYMIKKVEILSRRKFEVQSNLKIHLIEITSNEYNMDQIISFMEIQMKMKDKI